MDNSVKKIIVNGPYTTVLWNDGEKTVVKRKADDSPDLQAAFTAALAKKIYGSQNAVKRILADKVTYHKAKQKKVKPVEETTAVGRFKVGDTVKVIMPRNEEKKTYCGGWSPKMDKFEGYVGKIKSFERCGTAVRLENFDWLFDTDYLEKFDGFKVGDRVMLIKPDGVTAYEKRDIDTFTWYTGMDGYVGQVGSVVEAGSRYVVTSFAEGWSFDVNWIVPAVDDFPF